MHAAIRMGLAAVTAALLAAPAARAEERLDWGTVVAVGVEDRTLLVESERGFHLLAVDPRGIRGPRGKPAPLSTIRPGDRVDYIWSSYGGMALADLVDVTPRRDLVTDGGR